MVEMTQAEYLERIGDLYLRVRAYFETESQDPLRFPPSTAPQVGFAIFYAPPRFRAELLIIGQNPSNFSGERKPWNTALNAKRLSGTIPTENSYAKDQYLFAQRLKEGFTSEHHGLLVKAIGLNACFLQSWSNSSEARGKQSQEPHPETYAMCGKFVREILDLTQPRAILAIGLKAEEAVRPDSRQFQLHHEGSPVEGALISLRGRTPVFRVHHISASRGNIAQAGREGLRAVLPYLAASVADPEQVVEQLLALPE